MFFAHENMKKPASKVAEPAQIQPKSQFLFHKNLPPRDFSLMTLCKTKVTSDIFHKLRTVTKFLAQGQLDLRRFIENKTPLDSKKKTSHVAKTVRNPIKLEVSLRVYCTVQWILDMGLADLGDCRPALPKGRKYQMLKLKLRATLGGQ